MIIQATTKAEFLQVFNRLCVALREPQDDSGITQGVYFDALGDLTIDALRAGAELLMGERGRKFFPTTAEWRTAASQSLVEARRRIALPPGRSEPWKHECEVCEDTGWVQGLECDGGADQWPEDGPDIQVGKPKKGQPHGYKKLDRQTTTPRPAVCGRTKPHQPHSYTQVCPCRATNRTYLRHQAAMRGNS